MLICMIITYLIVYSYIFMIIYLKWNNVLQEILSSIRIFYANLQRFYMVVTRL